MLSTTFFFFNQLLLHEATNLAAFLSFPQLCHPALSRAVSHTEWWISSPFSRSFSFSEHCWHVNTELTANATNSRVNKAYLIHIFLHKVHHSFFALRDTKQHFRTRLHLEAILNMESPKKKHKRQKNMALNKLVKWHLFIVWEMKQDIGVSLSSTWTGNSPLDTQIFYHFARVH